MDTHETLTQIRKEERRKEISNHSRAETKIKKIQNLIARISHRYFFFLNKRIQEQAIQARFKLGWQSPSCSS
jgi:DNA polymerase III delta prime subunit